MAHPKKSVLFVCSYNSARSPMAEAILKAEKGELYEVYSAGIHPLETDRRAVFVMKEAGYDISKKMPLSLGRCSDKKYDYVVFLCENAYKNAPYIPEAKKIILHQVNMPSGFSDSLKGFAALRDELKDWIIDYFQ